MESLEMTKFFWRSTIASAGPAPQCHPVHIGALLAPVGYQHLWKAHTCAEKAVCQSSVLRQLYHTIWESFCQPGLIPGAHGASGKSENMPASASAAGKRGTQRQ